MRFEADSRGRGGLRQRPYPQAELLRSAQEQALAVTLSDGDREGLSGDQIGELLRRRRLAALKPRADQPNVRRMSAAIANR